MAADTFPALTGFYRLLFLHIEPLLAFVPIVGVVVTHGAAWFLNDLLPASVPSPKTPDPRAIMAVWQLQSCYFVVSALSSIVFRTVRDAVTTNPALQERLIGASLLALAIADIVHILATYAGLPAELRTDPWQWNGVVHGNLTVVFALFLARAAWFMGVGRTRYYFGVTKRVV